MRGVADYAQYMAFFPQLIAGPIIRYRQIDDQIRTPPPRSQRLEDIAEGFPRFALGLCKKVLIADQVAPLANAAFSDPSELTTAAAWIGALAFTVQIYFDFSGYSDMAIGLARMFGFRFPENFARPYSAVSMTDFWRRWHITLSRWFRDYVYIPLGGSRVSQAVTLRNLLIIFLLVGLWHGAAWTFVLWGLYNGGLLIVERVTGISRMPEERLAVMRRAGTFLLVVFGWVLFRADSVGEALDVYAAMLSPHSGALPRALDEALVGPAVLALCVGVASALLPRGLVMGRLLEGGWEGWSLRARMAVIGGGPAGGDHRGRGQLQPLPLLPVLMKRSTAFTTAFAIIALAFFALPVALRAVGVTATSFENRKFAEAPKPSQGWDVFQQTTRFLTDRMPLREQAVRANNELWRTFFDTNPRYGAATADGALPFAGQPPPATARRDKVPKPEVIEGRDGWLFLKGELERACTPLVPVPQALARWRQLVAMVRAAGKRAVLVIPPDKGSIYPREAARRAGSRTARRRAKRRFWDDLARTPAAWGVRGLERPLARRKRRGGTALYSKKDSHWNTLGSLTLVRAVLELLDEGVRLKPGEIVNQGRAAFVGDLTVLLGERAKETRPRYAVRRARVAHAAYRDAPSSCTTPSARRRFRS